MKGDWPTLPLGEIFEIARGGSPRPIQNFLTDDPSGINWIMISDATDSDKFIERTAKRIKPEGAKSSRRVYPGDFLLTNSMSFGRPYIMKTEGCIHDGWLHLRKRHPNVDEGYFYHLLGSPGIYAKFKQLAAGATVKNLNIDLVSNVRVPLPPLGEQSRIVDVLDKADAILAKRQDAIQLSDDLLRASFTNMFGTLKDESNNPVRLSDVVCLDAPMVDPRSDEYADFPHIGPDRIEKGNGQLLPYLTAREEALISKKFLFDERYVLYSKIRPALKKCALVDFRGLCSADMYPIRPISDDIPKEFVWGLLLSEVFDRYVATLPDRANIPKLNRTELAAFEFSLPPRDTLERYAALVRSTLAARKRQQEFAEHAERLFMAFGFFN